MYRTSTPVHSFTFPWKLDGTEHPHFWAEFTYKQGTTEVQKKYEKDESTSGFEVSDRTISYQLTSTQTKGFTEGKVDLQVRCGRTADECIVSRKYPMMVGDVLDSDIHS